MDLIEIYQNNNICENCNLPKNLHNYKNITHLKDKQLSSLSNILLNLPENILDNDDNCNLFINIVKLLYKHMNYDMDNYILKITDEKKLNDLIKEKLNEETLYFKNTKNNLNNEINILNEKLNNSEIENEKFNNKIKELNHQKNENENLFLIEKKRLMSQLNIIDSNHKKDLQQKENDYGKLINEKDKTNSQLFQNYENQINDLKSLLNGKMNTIEKYSGNIYNLYNSKKSSDRGKIGEKNMELLCPNENFAYYSHGQKKGNEGDGYYYHKEKENIKILAESKDYGKDTYLGEKEIDKFKRDLQNNNHYISGIFVAWNHIISCENIYHGEIKCYHGKYALYLCGEKANPNNDELRLLINLFYKFTENIHSHQKNIDNNILIKLWNKYFNEIKSIIEQKKLNYEKDDKIIKLMEKNLNDMKSQLKKNYSLDSNIENVIIDALSIDLTKNLENNNDNLIDDNDNLIDDNDNLIDNNDNLIDNNDNLINNNDNLIDNNDNLIDNNDNLIDNIGKYFKPSTEYCETKKTLSLYLKSKGITMNNNELINTLKSLGYELIDNKKNGKSKIKGLNNKNSKVDYRHPRFYLEVL